MRGNDTKYFCVGMTLAAVALMAACSRVSVDLVGDGGVARQWSARIIETSVPSTVDVAGRRAVPAGERLRWLLVSISLTPPQDKGRVYFVMDGCPPCTPRPSPVIVLVSGSVEYWAEYLTETSSSQPFARWTSFPQYHSVAKNVAGPAPSGGESYSSLYEWGVGEDELDSTRTCHKVFLDVRHRKERRFKFLYEVPSGASNFTLVMR